MGTNNIPSATDGNPIPASDHNSIQEALANDIVPRNTSGAPTANQGDLGSSTYPFKRAEITSGYFFAGMIMPVHTYNGAITPGHGWMKCDGRVINESNYNTEHGAGTWATFVVSSLLDGKYLPDLTGDKYLTGVSSTTQTGSSSITEVGVSGHQINLAHSHTVASHIHKWFGYNQSNQNSKTYNGSGTLIDLPSDSKDASASKLVVDVSFSSSTGLQDSYTSPSAPSSDSQLSSTQSIRPRSVEVVFYMRII